MNSSSIYFVKWSLIVLFCQLINQETIFAQKSASKPRVISYVDVRLDGSQKYTLKVDGKPFYMTAIQIRLDNMRYVPSWNAAATEAVIAQAAADKFNTVAIPIHWREVEPEKDKFDWSVLDEYLGLINKHNIKMEMLWFGTNSGGITQRLGRSDHLRTPDYVLFSPVTKNMGGYDTYSPGKGRSKTTSEYTILRDLSDYSLDLADKNLRLRETYVLSKVMAHIASWDEANDSKHPLIGVQIGNEVLGYGKPFPNSLVISYLSDVASAVKKSDYVVWTRVNSVTEAIPGRIIENESQRLSPLGTNIDFVGIDTYRHHYKSDEDFVASMRTHLPYVGKNYRMIMETNSNVPNAAQFRLAALSGNTGLNYYDFSGLYDPNGLRPRVAFIEDIRLVNKIISSDLADIATKASGYGLFVHNWEGVNSATTKSAVGIAFSPSYPTSQGISIIRNNTQIVLMSTKGGEFTLPDSLQITGASKGFFDGNNEWVNQGDISLGNRAGSRGASILLEPGTTVLLTLKNSGDVIPAIQQAEFAQLGGGANMESSVEGIGFAGNGYVQLPATEGAYINWSNIDGMAGGMKTIRVRYSNGGPNPIKTLLDVNGKIQTILLPQTGSWATYQYFTTTVPLNKGTNNKIRLETGNNTIRIERTVNYDAHTNIDELQTF